jgi:hypothetical protein
MTGTAWRVWVQAGKRRALAVGVYTDRAKADQQRDSWRGYGLTCITPASAADIDEPSLLTWRQWAIRKGRIGT